MRIEIDYQPNTQQIPVRKVSLIELFDQLMQTINKETQNERHTKSDKAR